MPVVIVEDTVDTRQLACSISFNCGDTIYVHNTFNMNREGFTEDLKFNKQIKKHKNLVLLPNVLKKGQNTTILKEGDKSDVSNISPSIPV